MFRDWLRSLAWLFKSKDEQKNIVVLGPPGSGKTIEAKKLAERYKLCFVSGGDIVRELAQLHQGLTWEVRKKMYAGTLVPDHIVAAALEKHLKRWECRPGFLLEGFPRSPRQVDMLDDLLKKRKQKISAVIQFTADDEFVKRRVSERRVHWPSDRTYYPGFYPSKEPDRDDITGEPIHVRRDDNPDLVAMRLKIYHEKTEPVIEIFKQRKLWLGSVPITPNRSADDLFADVIKLLEPEKPQ